MILQLFIAYSWWR